jgi:hypothetical protein
MSFCSCVARGNDLVSNVTAKLAFIAPLATHIVIGHPIFHTGAVKVRLDPLLRKVLRLESAG